MAVRWLTKSSSGWEVLLVGAASSRAYVVGYELVSRNMEPRYRFEAVATITRLGRARDLQGVAGCIDL